MPRQLWRWIALLLFVPTSLAHAEDARWMEVEQHLERGRPRSALVAIRPILNHALQQKSYAEASRALATRIVVEAMIEGGDPRLRVELLEAALPETPDEMHPVLHAVAARWMWHYFTRNRYRISARTRGGVSARDAARQAADWLDRVRQARASGAHATGSCA